MSDDAAPALDVARSSSDRRGPALTAACASAACASGTATRVPSTGSTSTRDPGEILGRRRPERRRQEHDDQDPGRRDRRGRRARSSSTAGPGTPPSDRDRVAVVHQEPQLFPNLTVAENMMVGREGTRALRPRSRPARASLHGRPRHPRPRATCRSGSVPLAIQQRDRDRRGRSPATRGCSCSTSPTRRSPRRNRPTSSGGCTLLADAGRVVILVSHRIAELAEHADRVALILDGMCTDRARGRGT